MARLELNQDSSNPQQFFLNITDYNDEQSSEELVTFFSQLNIQKKGSLTVQCDGLRPETAAIIAAKIVSILSAPEFHSILMQINLPSNCEHTAEQVTIDNIISNNQRQSNIERPTENITLPAVAPRVEARILPKQIKPKISIIHFSEPEEDLDQQPQNDRKTKSNLSNKESFSETMNESTQRLPLPACVVDEILAQSGYESLKLQWLSCASDRNRAIEFRLNALFPASTQPLNQHPLHYLLREQPELKDKLQQWTGTLNLSTDQYNSLLDVYGQHGTGGLTELFNIWNAYNLSECSCFMRTHNLLLKKMPSYRPFIESSAFNQDIKNIATLGEAKLSWWFALIKNHDLSRSDQNEFRLLYKEFLAQVKLIENMKLTFKPIEAIVEIRSLPETLTDMVALLEKCNPGNGDRGIQWDCIYQVKVSLHSRSKYHFIVPEMKLDEPDLQEIGLIDLKLFFNNSPNCSEVDIKPRFYRYLAQQKHRLSLRDYTHYLGELAQNKIPDNPIKDLKEQGLNDQAKLGLAYILAKYTSTNLEMAFDEQSVKTEWERFSSRLIEIDYLNRMLANRNFFDRNTLITGMRIEGGVHQLRFEALNPIINQQESTLLSFLNILLETSEYDFLDPSLSIMNMRAKQKFLMEQTERAAAIYSKYPDAAIKAIRLIKRDTLIEKDGKYIPDKEKDIGLLTRFNKIAEILVDIKYKNNPTDNLDPQSILFPLLTTFHLEYEEVTTINQRLEFNQIITDYLSNVERIRSDQEKVKLFAYSLTLLQSVRFREIGNQRLTKQTLKEIQTGLMGLLEAPDQVMTRKKIRQWMDGHYGAFFGDSPLLKAKDQVDISTHLDSIECNDLLMREAITKMVSHFDEPSEIENHPNLATLLAQLKVTLSDDQLIHFFSLYQKELESNGIFSREKQAVPPSYLHQFTLLIETLVKNQSFAEAERFIGAFKESVLHGNENKNGLGRCQFLLSTLYPVIREQGVTRKNALKFSIDLVCYSRLNDLKSAYPESKSKAELEAMSQNFRLLVALSRFNELPFKTQKNLDEFAAAINQIIVLNQENSESFRECRRVVGEINNAIDRMKGRAKNSNFFQNAVTLILGKVPTATAEELTSLGENDLLTLIGETSSTYQELKRVYRHLDLGIHLYQQKINLLEKYNNISARADDFFTQALKHLAPEDLNKKNTDICDLINALIELDDQDLVLSLMYHFSGGAYGDVTDLDYLLTVENYYKELPSALKKAYIKAITSQMNNGVSWQHMANSIMFLKFVHTYRELDFITTNLTKFYQKAPYPPLSEFISWHKEGTDFDREYSQFDKNPCGPEGREKDNGFHRQLAEQRVREMPEIRAKFDKAYLDRIAEQQQSARDESTQNLITVLTRLKDHPPIDQVKMTMYLAELLHRSKGVSPVFVGDKRINGRSYELNTTQIIAILAMLETGKKVTAEICTGEGKSWMMMILNASLFLRGQNPILVTSNSALAERDYLNSLPFLSALGASVHLVNAASKIDAQPKGGVYITCDQDLCGHHTKALSNNPAATLLGLDPDTISISFDEADVHFIDRLHLPHSYSAPPSEDVKKLELVYPLIMGFFAQSDSEKVYKEDKKRCNQLLLADIHRRSPELDALMTSLPEVTLEQLLDAGYEARHLKYNEHYVVVSEAVQSTSLGDKKVAKAMGYIQSRTNEHAVFPKYVHQCLHAELNRLMASASKQELDESLQTALNTCKRKGRVFPIEPVREIAFSFSMYTLLKEHIKGYCYAMTGTIGNKSEQKEVKDNFGMHFIRVPRHKGLNRHDRAIRITENEEGQLNALVTHILESRKNNQPVLLICKSDGESEALYRKIAQHPSLGANRVHRVHAATDYEDSISEANYITKMAGNPGQVTITTEMIGRGTDIELHGLSIGSGLKVLLTYLPAVEREEQQIFGRSGRYGALGDTQMVLNLEQLKTELGIDYLNPDFYRYPELFIKRLQIFSAYTQKIHRLFATTLEAHLLNYKEEADQLIKQDPSMTTQWSEFTKKYSSLKEQTELSIKIELEQKKPNLGDIQALLNTHQQQALNCWNELVPAKPAKVSEMPAISPPALLNQWLKALKELPSNPNDLVWVTVKHKIQVHKQNDPSALGGRVHLLENPPLFGNWQASYEAHKKDQRYGLFPNLIAWWRKELSLWNYLSQLPFFNLFMKPYEQEVELKIQVPSSFAQVFKNNPEFMNSDSDEEKLIDMTHESQKVDPRPPSIEKAREPLIDEADHPHSPTGP